MRIALIHSMQPHNRYTGQPTNEMVQMRSVARQLGKRWRDRGIDVIVHPGTDITRSGSYSHADNVAWVNAEHRRRKVDLLISLHSNAAGDSMVLWGTSKVSARYGQTIMDALNGDNPFPGDRWTYYPRKVSELTQTRMPAVLLELSRHDRPREAAHLVRVIATGQLAAHLDRVLSRALNLPLPVITTETTSDPEEDIMATIDELRTVLREELDAYGRAPITVSAGTDREWTTTRDQALAAAAEMEKLAVAGEVIRLDDAMAELLNAQREDAVEEVGEVDPR
ncbi:MAG: N-acetylmuramoyl-L-alanine amidase [Propionibacteriaceae bacterium]|nr:N-acetylmuramoyl-L-alanine amidase [Propionibacteriaceae bacterium]